jgi:preprotein translocase subunit SecD
MRLRSALLGLALLLVLAGGAASHAASPEVLVLRANATGVSSKVMHRALHVMTRRVERLGVQSPQLSLRGRDEIAVVLPSAGDRAGSLLS